jgi:S-DNA-T family DNA segregation ATPase FtsK/SpoIIIE
MGADRLLGNGDMLFLWPGTSTLLRGQGAFVDDQEIRNVVNFLATSEPQFVQELLELKPKLPAGATGPATGGSKDDLYDAAVEVVLREGRGSVSLLQRALGIGYGRAARLIDYMAEDGIVGAYNGSQARDVLISLAEWHARQGAEEEPPVPRRRNKVVMTLQEQDEEEQQDISRLGGGPVVPGPHVSQRKGRGAAASLPVDRRPLRGGGAMTADDDPVEDEILNADENDPDDRDFDHRQPADSSGSE